MVNSLMRGGERVLSFEYGMPMCKERLGSAIPDPWTLLGSKTLSITLCTVSRRAIGSFGTEATLFTEACETRRFFLRVRSEAFGAFSASRIDTERRRSDDLV